MSDNNRGFGGVGFGKNAQPINVPTPKPKSNENLTASLRASLRVIENEDENPIPSPLEEATPDSVEIFLDRINNHMIEGKILTDEDLKQGIDLYRSQALRYAQEKENKKPRSKSAAKATIKEVLDLGDLGELF